MCSVVVLIKGLGKNRQQPSKRPTCTLSCSGGSEAVEARSWSAAESVAEYVICGLALWDQPQAGRLYVRCAWTIPQDQTDRHQQNE